MKVAFRATFLFLLVPTAATFFTNSGSGSYASLFAQDSLKARIPPGQCVAENFPLLHYGEIPDIDHDSRKLIITGSVKKKITLDWDRFDYEKNQ